MKSSTIILLFILPITTLFSVFQISFCEGSSSTLMAINQSSSPTSHYIVYTEQPVGDDHEASHLRTLSSVLGSEEAAKESLIYVYKSAATGFSAKLTPEQASQLERQPGVLQIVADKPVHLHSAGGVMNV